MRVWKHMEVVRLSISYYIFHVKNYSEFLIIFAFVRKCRFSLELQAFPTFSVVEDTPHISAFFSLTSQSKVVKR